MNIDIVVVMCDMECLLVILLYIACKDRAIIDNIKQKG